MEYKANPIALQSKEWLADALVRLLEIKPYHKITITELAKYANLDRRTFYRNFASRDAVLAYRIDSIIHEFQVLIQQQIKLDAYVIAKAYFEVCARHTNFLIALNRQGLTVHLLHAFDMVLPSLTKKYISRKNDKSEDDFDYVLFFYAGGFWHLSDKWLQEGAKKNPDQLAALVPIVMKRLINEDHNF